MLRLRVALLACLFSMALGCGDDGSSSPSDAGPDASEGECLPGVADCECRANGECAGMLECVVNGDVSVCEVPDGCVTGSEGCPCGTGDACDTGLRCESEVCVGAQGGPDQPCFAN